MKTRSGLAQAVLFMGVLATALIGGTTNVAVADDNDSVVNEVEYKPIVPKEKIA